MNETNNDNYEEEKVIWIGNKLNLLTLSAK